MKNILRTILATALLLWGNALLAEDIRIGVEGAYPPFSTTNPDGSVTGFDIDIANALCTEMGHKCTMVKQDWDGIIPALLARKYDAIVASMSITDARKKRVDFTDKYYQMPVKFVAAKGANVEISKSGLRGKKIGVQRATTFDDYATDKYGSVAEVVRYTSQEEVYLDLQAKRLDVTLAERASVEDGFLDTPAGKPFELVGPDITDQKWFGDGIGIALRKDDDDLRKQLNKAIKKIRRDGTYKKINDKYFSYDIYGK